MAACVHPVASLCRAFNPPALLAFRNIRWPELYPRPGILSPMLESTTLESSAMTTLHLLNASYRLAGSFRAIQAMAPAAAAKPVANDAWRR